MEYLIGLASGIALFALLGAAVYVGTKINKPTPKAVNQLTEDERRKAEDMKKGFGEMMSYSMEKARGSRIER